MNLDDMQKRLQALFANKQNFEQQAEKLKQNCLMIQGHINELSFLIQQLAEPALESVSEGESEQQPEEQAA